MDRPRRGAGVTWRVHRELDETTRTLRRGVVRLYPERARDERRQVAALIAAGVLLVFAAYHLGRGLFSLFR